MPGRQTWHYYTTSPRSPLHLRARRAAAQPPSAACLPLAFASLAPDEQEARGVPEHALHHHPLSVFRLERSLQAAAQRALHPRCAQPRALQGGAAAQRRSAARHNVRPASPRAKTPTAPGAVSARHENR